MGAEAVRVQRSSLDIVLQEPTLVVPVEPTEKHVYFLSNLDQNLTYDLTTVYFYEAKEEKRNEDPAMVLRKALSEVLVHYPPVAGRFGISEDGKLNVLCHDQGVLFAEGDTEARLADLSDSTTLAQFVYVDPAAKGILDLPMMVVQVTRFKCGGFALGLAMNHSIYDGIAAMEFLNSWAETARGEPISVPPHLDRRILAHREPLKIEYPHHEFAEIPLLSETCPLRSSGDIVYRSFCFDTPSLIALKSSLLQETILKRCTTFEILTAMVWRARTKALGMPGSQKSKLLFAVNGRNKFLPPLPKGYLGNGIVMTCATTTAEDLTNNRLSHAIALVQKSIDTVDDSFMRSCIDYFEKTRARPSLNSTLLITTWSRLPMHAIDFGYGHPEHTGPVSLPKPEVVLFVCSGKGRTSMKVVMGLPTKAMERFSECVREEMGAAASHLSQFERNIKELTLKDIM